MLDQDAQARFDRLKELLAVVKAAPVLSFDQVLSVTLGFASSVVGHAVLVINDDQRIALASERSRDVLGYTPGELIGEPISILIPEEFRAGHDAMFRRYLGTGQATVPWIGRVLPVLLSDGQIEELSVSIGTIEVMGQRAFMAVLHRVSYPSKDGLEAVKHAG